jgi:uncharacterized protein (DUF2267 family)
MRDKNIAEELVRALFEATREELEEKLEKARNSDNETCMVLCTMFLETKKEEEDEREIENSSSADRRGA